MRIYLLIIVKLFNWLVFEKEFGERIKHLEESSLFAINFLFLSNKQADIFDIESVIFIS